MEIEIINIMYIFNCHNFIYVKKNQNKSSDK